MEIAPQPQAGPGRGARRARTSRPRTPPTFWSKPLAKLRNTVKFITVFLNSAERRREDEREEPGEEVEEPEVPGAVGGAQRLPALCVRERAADRSAIEAALRTPLAPANVALRAATVLLVTLRGSCSKELSVFKTIYTSFVMLSTLTHSTHLPI